MFTYDNLQVVSLLSLLLLVKFLAKYMQIVWSAADYLWQSTIEEGNLESYQLVGEWEWKKLRETKSSRLAELKEATSSQLQPWIGKIEKWFE